ncbi:MAG: hypothetical protein LKE40_12825 [Spirochaetia bacterium]|nr:hypothetical protein [Spirochaetia bacterium]
MLEWHAYERGLTFGRMERDYHKTVCTGIFTVGGSSIWMFLSDDGGTMYALQDITNDEDILYCTI